MPGGDQPSVQRSPSSLVWTDTFSSTDHDIRAQRYNSFGGKLGPEIVVSFSSLDEDHAKVAIDGAGRFEVAWTQQVGSDSNVVAQRFDSNGNAVGGVIQVANNSSQREYDPSIAADLFGDFVISYTHDFSSARPGHRLQGVQRRAWDAYRRSTTRPTRGLRDPLQRRDRSEVRAGRRGVGAGLQPDRPRHLSGPLLCHPGRFLGKNTISFSSLYDQAPAVSMDNAGDAVVAWEQNNNIVAMRVSSTGAQGSQINIASTSNVEYGPSVALRTDGGGFVVTYEDLSSTSATAAQGGTR